GVDIDHCIGRVLEAVVGSRRALHARLHVALRVAVNVAPEFCGRKRSRLSGLHPAGNFIGSGEVRGGSSSAPVASRESQYGETESCQHRSTWIEHRYPFLRFSRI